MATREQHSPACSDGVPNRYFDSTGFPDSMSLSKLNPVELPWYVTNMPGGVGRVAREMSPYPDHG
jgi:hypothetical protein